MQNFYRSLDVVNKGIANQLVHSGIIKQTFERASELLDKMTKINQVWYTQDDMVTPLILGLTKEQIEKNQERDENMTKIMAQLYLLTQHIIGSKKVVNAIKESGSSS